MLNKPSFMPVYQQVKGYLKEEIAKGSFMNADKLPSEPELARMLGVNRQTIRKATGLLCQEGLLAIVKGKGTFIVSSRKSKLLQKKSIGLIYPFDIDEKFIGLDYYFGTIMSEVINNTNYDRFRVTPFTMRSDTIIDIYSSNNLDGMVIVAPRNEHLEELKKLQDTDIPLVVVGSSMPKSRINYIDSDNIQGARIMMEYLYGLGHRRIAFVGESSGIPNHTDRLNEYRNFLKRAGIETTDDYIILKTPEMSYEELGYRGAGRLAGLASRPTAVCCVNTSVLAGVMQGIKQAGLRIPGDISVTGFDDPREMSLAEPPITVVKQPLEEMCAKAVQEIQKRTTSRTAGIVQLSMEMKLVERASCASPSA